MFPLTITLHTADQLTAVMVALKHLAGPANERAAALLATEAAMADTVEPKPATKAEAPGKPAAATAPSPRTAEVAPASVSAAPAPSPEATPPAAAAPSVSYPDLQKAVLTLHKMDPSAAVPIAKGLGADTFKLLPESKWGDALAQVNAAIEARRG